MDIVKNIFRNVGRLVQGFRVGLTFTKVSDGTYTLTPSIAADRNVLIAVKVTETFAAGDGAKPTFKIGQTASTSKFAATTAFSVSAIMGDVLIFSGVLSSGAALLVTVTAATGTATGALAVEAIVLPATV
jgi:hypothetical protein